MSPFQLGILAALGTALLWTTSTCAWSEAGRYLTAMAICVVRLLLTTAMLVAYGWLAHGRPLPTEAPPYAWKLFGISGLIGFFIADLCYFRSILVLGPRLTLLLQSFAPPITALLSWFFLGEPLTGKGWLGMVLTLVGVVWVVLERPEPIEKSRYPRTQERALGITLSVLAAIGLAVGQILSRRGMGYCDPVSATFIRVLGGLAGFIVLISFQRRWGEIGRAMLHRQAMPILVVGSLLGPVLGVIANMFALQKCTAPVAVTIIATMPIMVLPIMIFVYGERVSPRAAGGAVLSVLGVALLSL